MKLPYLPAVCSKNARLSSCFLTPILSLILMFPAERGMAGIIFSSQSTTGYPAPAAASRAVMGDFDGDGDVDILYQTGGNGTAFQYARSNGDGTYTLLSQAASPFAGLTLPDNTGGNYYAVDLDGDGDIDVVVGVNSATGSYFRNDGSSFSSQSTTTFPAPASATRLLIADFDGDGDADILYQTGANGTAFQYARNNGNSTFTIVSQASSPFAGLTMPDFVGDSYKAADFDGDGDIDVWAPVASATGSYFRNDGSSFSSQSSSSFPAPAGISRVVVGDFDSDGDADILYQTGGNGTAFQYARSNGDGTFTIVAQASSPFAGLTLPDNTTNSYYAGDIDGDGDIDIWAAVASSTGSYLREEGSPPFVASSSPADNATNVFLDANITLNFSESVSKGTGNIYIVRTSDNAVIQTIPVTGALVTGSGSSWKVNPSSNLAASTAYAVRADSKTFVDVDGAIYKGIKNNTALNFTTGTLLPLIFINFSCYPSGKQVIVQWQTASEQNSRSFTVERSTDGILYIPIATQPAAGNSNTVRSYQYTDPAPPQGAVYYRVAETDIDGAVTYSTVAVVTLSANASVLQVRQGDPATRQVTIVVQSNTGYQYLLSVYAANGKLVYNNAVSDGTYTIATQNWSKGIYIVVLRQGASVIAGDKLIHP